MSSIDTISKPGLVPASLAATLMSLAVRHAALWWRAARTRRHFADLSDDALTDIGLTRRDVMAEAARPFWDVAPDPRGTGSRTR